MITVEVTYHAFLREQRGCSSETLKTDVPTPLALYTHLCAEHGFTYPADRMKVAVNDAFTNWAHVLQDGDRVTYVPPVAGG